MVILRWAVPLLAALLAIAPAPPATRGAAPAPVPSALAPPRLTRARMEEALGPASCWRLVVGTRDPALAPLLRARALGVARRLGADSSAVVTDREARAADLAPCLLALFGGPEANEWTARLAPALPVSFHPGGFRWAGRDYDRAGDAIHLAYPSPLDPRRFVLLVAGNSAAALHGEGGEPLFGAEDWRIYRDGVLRRSGVFAQDPARPWRYDPALDRDRDEDERRFAATLRVHRTPGVVVRAPAGLALAEPALAGAARLLARLDAAGLRAPGALTLTLYRSLEEKGAITGDTRPEQVAGGEAHAAPAAGRPGLDLTGVAGARLVRAGADPGSPWLEGASAWLAGRYDGEPLAAAVARLYYGGLLPSARLAAAPPPRRSRLISVPARALLLGAAGAGGARALLPALGARAPRDLEDLARATGMRAAEIERRYRGLADSLARGARAALLLRAPAPWTPRDGFQAGVCLAHEPGLTRGYLSTACAGELARLAAMGARAVSLTPFGFLPASREPDIAFGPVGEPEEETDEAVAEAAARAHALGLRVWLAPQVWTRGWSGDLSFGPEGWDRFLDGYREMLLHDALLAERERIEGLVVGHELVSSSLRDPARWRAMIAEVRRVYHGTLTYDANWGEEAKGIAFWDAVDLVGVSFYGPLTDRPTTAARTLREGARRQLAELRAVAARARRPLLLAEVGYVPDRMAPVRPWEESRGAPSDEAQRACYQAVVEALDGEEWVAGVLWWKWFTAAAAPSAPSYSPRGRPAEAVLRRAFALWAHRAVQPPLAGAAR